LINSSNYNLYIHCCCWRFGNRCCLRQKRNVNNNNVYKVCNLMNLSTY